MIGFIFVLAFISCGIYYSSENYWVRGVGFLIILALLIYGVFG